MKISIHLPITSLDEAHASLIEARDRHVFKPLINSIPSSLILNDVKVEIPINILLGEIAWIGSKDYTSIMVEDEQGRGMGRVSSPFLRSWENKHDRALFIVIDTNERRAFIVIRDPV